MSRWVNAAAVEWVLYEVHVPATLVSTFVAVASFIGTDGRVTYPSTETVATMTNKSVRQTQRDLDALEALGLLVRGNQHVTEYLRADRRPTVFDMPPAAREFIRDKFTRDVIHDTPYGRSPMSPRRADGVTSGRRRGDSQRVIGVTSMTPEEVMKSSEDDAPSAPDVGAADGAPPIMQVAVGPFDRAEMLASLRADLATKRGNVRVTPCE